jgi:hypothetical protein
MLEPRVSSGQSERALVLGLVRPLSCSVPLGTLLSPSLGGLEIVLRGDC